MLIIDGGDAKVEQVSWLRSHVTFHQGSALSSSSSSSSYYYYS
jgi:hypothetical protein